MLTGIQFFCSQEEQNVIRFEVGQDSGEVSGPLEYRARCLPEVDAHLVGNDVRKRRFAETRRSEDQDVIKGLAAPETANNAACTGSFVPLLTLGIPGSGTTAILLGALIALNVTPGPRSTPAFCVR